MAENRNYYWRIYSVDIPTFTVASRIAFMFNISDERLLQNQKLNTLYAWSPSIFHWWVGHFQLQGRSSAAPILLFVPNFCLKILNLHLLSSRCNWGRGVETVSDVWA